MRSDPMVGRSTRRAGSGAVVADGRPVEVPDALAGDSVHSLLNSGVGVDRPIRGGTLRDILDAEYRRCYRFESFSGLVDDLKGLIRRVVARDDAEGESLRSSFPARN